MTVELARRLIESGVPPAEVEAALLLVVERGMALTEALAEQDPELLARVEQDLGRADLPSVLTVRASPELCARLPRGLCRRLLAVPVHVDPRTGRVDVAAVDPLDPHVAQELSYHLNQPVRVLYATLDAVKSALERLQRGAKLSGLPPSAGVGSDAPIPLVKADPTSRSDAPIPLVKRSMLPVRSPTSVAPAAGSALGQSVDAGLSWRSKPPPVDLVAGAAQLDRQAAEAAQRAVEQAPASVRERLEEAVSPDAVLELLRDALAPAVSCVFTVKNASFDGRIASAAVEQRTPAKQLSLLSHQPSVLETAVKSGFYLGPIPNTPNHRELRDALPPDTADEVYVTVITVSDRPSLVWLLAGFQHSLDLTRRADEIALVAGRALARILRQRKRSS